MSEKRVCSFVSEIAMRAALKRIWIEYLKEKIGEGEQAKDTEGRLHTDLSGLWDNEIAELKLCGRKEGDFVTDNGTTIAYAAGLKAYNLEKWYFFKSPEKYLVNAVGYTVEDYNVSWEYPEDV